MYIPVKGKLAICTAMGSLWLVISWMILLPWVEELKVLFAFWVPYAAWVVVFFLAFVPGFANVFIMTGLLMDSRPEYTKKELEDYPDITVLIAAYNEEESIEATIESVAKQEYGGHLNVIVIDDGSKDNTVERSELAASRHKRDNLVIHTLMLDENVGKARALVKGLAMTGDEFVITIDADTYLYKDAINNIVCNIVLGPPNTAAVAGTPLVRNSRKNWITKIQEWDYFHGISVVKRVQSLFQGTLVAQGSFSIYRTDALNEVGGWPDAVGEDIVLTWALRAKGYRIGYDETAIAFTNVPEDYKTFFHQRKRWSRGLIEAFKIHPKTITDIKMNTPFVWIYLFIPFVDTFYLFIFMPGALASLFFGYDTIVGVYILVMLPIVFLSNWIFYINQTRIFKKMGLKVRRNIFGFTWYMLIYQVLVAPAAVTGYLSEVFNTKKTWGTK